MKVQQETTDRFMSGDYVGAWDLYSSTFKKGISRSDYGKLGATCNGASGSNLPVTVKGVRLESADKAIVRLELMGTGQSRTMTYENGHWAQEPNPEFAKELGKPVDKVIADEKAGGGCTGS